MMTISSATPGQLLTELQALADVVVVLKDGENRLRVTPKSQVPQGVVDAVTQCKPEIIAMIVLEGRLDKGLAILRTMEAAGQMETGKYAQRLQKWERLDREYRDLHDGLVKAGVRT